MFMRNFSSAWEAKCFIYSINYLGLTHTPPCSYFVGDASLAFPNRIFWMQISAFILHLFFVTDFLSWFLQDFQSYLYIFIYWDKIDIPYPALNWSAYQKEDMLLSQQVLEINNIFGHITVVFITYIFSALSVKNLTNWFDIFGLDVTEIIILTFSMCFEISKTD